MAYTVPSIEPDSLVAGDTWTWTRSVSQFPASDGWALTYYFASNGQTPITASATASGADFLVTIPAATSATFAAGDWFWTVKASKSGEVHTVNQGRFTVAPNPATFTGDPRSLVKKTLDAIRSCIYGTASKDEGSMTVDGIALSLRPIDELRRLEASFAMKYRNEVAAERSARGLAPNSRIQVRFSRPN